MTDRYSDNHKISVANGSGTLTIDGDVAITGDLAFSGTATGDVLFSGDITASGQVLLDAAETYVVAIPAADFVSAVTTAGAPSVGFVNAGPYIAVEQPNEILFFKALSSRIPDGAAIHSISMFSSVTDALNQATLTLYRQTHGDITSTAMCHAGPANDLVMTENVSSVLVVGNVVDYSTKFYYLKLHLDASAGAGGSFVNFAGAKVTYLTKKLGQ